jgi:hypothetical protein
MIEALWELVSNAGLGEESTSDFPLRDPKPFHFSVLSLMVLQSKSQYICLLSYTPQ